MKKHLLVCFLGLSLAFGLNAQTEVLLDNSLETTGGGGTDWSSTSTNFGTVLCDAACGNCGGPCAPHTGTYYAWFGGAGAAEVGTLSQNFTVGTGGNAALTFWLLIPSGGVAADSVAIGIDGTQVWGKVGNDTVGFDSAYAMVTVPLGTLAAGPHSILVGGVETGTAPGSYNVLMDDFSIMVGGTAGTEIILLEEHIYMFHNGNSLQMSFNLPEAADMTISMIDMNGKIVSVKSYDQLQNETLTMSTTGLANGIYTVNFVKGNHSAISKKIYINQ